MQGLVMEKVPLLQTEYAEYTLRITMSQMLQTVPPRLCQDPKVIETKLGVDVQQM